MQPVRKTPSVIPRSAIPVSPPPEDRSLEVRPFHAHELLGSVLPTAAVAMAWTKARPGQEVDLRSHATPGLLIVLEGDAELVGRVRRKVQAGDVITLPTNHEYGFTEIGAKGLHALHVAFGQEVASKNDQAQTLQQLLSRNDARMQIALSNPFFSLLRNRRVDNSRRRTAMRECLRVFSDAFQTLLFTRQATCRDARYAPSFNQHLREELGHNQLLKVSGSSSIARDPRLLATSAWFCHQMLVLDNAEKAAVNLVLETAGYYLGTLAGPLFSGQESSGYFDTHAEDDAHHKDVGIRLLEGLHPQTYGRLQRVLDSSWDMLEAMTRRFAHLIELDTRSS
jgi:quercetin dioxygenase-like cupin family protein